MLWGSAAFSMIPCEVMGPDEPLSRATRSETARPAASRAGGGCDVSVVIVNYRVYDELDACLASLGGAPGIEVIVVDHESTPGQAGRLRARHPRVTFVMSDANPGFAAGVNAGARLASGRHFLLLNPDTRIQPDAIPSMRDYLDRHPEIGVVGPRIVDSDGTIQQSARAFPRLLTGLAGRTSPLTRVWPGNPWSRSQLLARAASSEPVVVDWVAGSCLMARSEAFRAVGGFDESFFLYWEDADFCKRLAEAGWPTAYLPAAAVMHLVGRSSRHARARSIRAFHASAYRYFARHSAGRLRLLSLPAAAALLYARMAIKLAALQLTGPRHAEEHPQRHTSMR